MNHKWIDAEGLPPGEHWRLVCGPPDDDAAFTVEIRTVKMTSGSDNAQELATMECILLDYSDLEFVVPILTRELERMRHTKSKRSKATEGSRAPDLKTADKAVDLFEALKESLKR